MFNRKPPEKKRSKASGGLSQFGLLDVPGLDSGVFNENDDGESDEDESLEAELLALTGGLPLKLKQSHVLSLPKGDLDAMVAESLQDIPSDQELSDDEDPAILAELSGLIGDDEETPTDGPPTKDSMKTEPENNLLSTLQQRLTMYIEAERNAELVGDSTKARRFSRGIKTLNDMLKQATAGRVVNETDIPPPVVTSIKKPVPTAIILPQIAGGTVEPVEPVEPGAGEEAVQPEPVAADSTHSASTVDQPAESISSQDSDDIIGILTQRRQLYKVAALEAKKRGDMPQALEYVRVVKGFEPLLAAAQQGQSIDLGSLPPSPPTCTTQPDPTSLQEQTEASLPAPVQVEGADGGEAEHVEAPQPPPPPAPASVREALEQRLGRYRAAEQAAREEGNSSKVRRLGRIVKQYEGAIRLHDAGKPIPVDELPTPPGFAPIPVEGVGSSAPTVLPTAEDQVAGSAPPEDASAAPPAPPALPTRPAPPVLPTNPAPPALPTRPAPPPPTASVADLKANVRKSPQSRQEKQLSLLLLRQKKFKVAALEAKRKGELLQAKEYLRLAKGFDPLIEASNNGLPVDLDSLPIPPEQKAVLEADFDVVTLEDCIPGSDAEIYEKLENDLGKQTQMCLRTRDHFRAIGDIASANRFEQLALHSRKDLDAVRCAHKRSDPIPKFHYETRSFNIVQCCTDLGDNDLELTVMQGINYTVANPKDVDTYVKFEFPYPNEAPVRDQTAVVKDTNNPQYNQTFLLPIQRSARACQRVFKRNALRLEVWSRGGFFRRDTLIGTIVLKLLPLETKCKIHDAFDLMEGRRAVGGRLEVRLRLRNPIISKQVERMQEKWLVIDRFD